MCGKILRRSPVRKIDTVDVSDDWIWIVCSRVSSGRRRGCRTFSQIVTFRFGMYAFIHAHVRTYSSRSRYGRAVGPLENIADSLDTMPWSLNWNRHKTLISSREIDNKNDNRLTSSGTICAQESRCILRRSISMMILVKTNTNNSR